MALNEVEVRILFERHLKVMKPFFQKNGRKAVEPWDGFTEACEQRERLGPHIVPGARAEWLFKNRAPNQTDEELTYMDGNYRQSTLPVFGDLENTVARGMHPNNWSLEFDGTAESERVKTHIETGVREWGSLYNFLRFAGISMKVHDAMGLLVVAPDEVPTVPDEEGVDRVDSTVEIRPNVHYFPCEHLWGFEYEKWYLVLKDERSEVMRGNTTVYEGLVLWLIDDENIWQIRQYGQVNDWTFDIGVEFPHGIGEPPCVNWLGKPRYKGGRVVWESPYLQVKDLLDMALLKENYLQVTEANILFPHPVVVGDECRHLDEEHGVACFEGYLTWPDPADTSKEQRHKCPKCNGTGRSTQFGRLRQTIVKPSGDPMGGGDFRIDATNAVHFVSPEVATGQFTRAEIQDHERRARAIMHLDTDAPMAGGEFETATKSGLRSRSRDAFAKTIIDQLFVIKGYLIRWSGKMIVGPEWDGFTLRPPTQYDLRTDADHYVEITAAMKDGLPPFMVVRLLREYIASRYPNDPEFIADAEVLVNADRLVGMPVATIQADSAGGRIKPWELTLHYSGIMLLEAERQKPGWQELDAEGRAERLRSAAQQQVVAAPSTVPAAQQDAAMGALTVVRDTEVPNTEGEAVQDTALNGSQVTSLVEIVVNMSTGVMTKATGTAVIKAAFPSMDERLIASIVAGVKEIDPELVQ